MRVRSPLFRVKGLWEAFGILMSKDDSMIATILERNANQYLFFAPGDHVLCEGSSIAGGHRPREAEIQADSSF